MVDDMPTYDGSEPGQFKTLLNGQSSAADEIHQQIIDEVHDADSVPTAEDLPETGNWVGRITMAEDDDQLWVCASLPAGWVKITNLGYATTTPTPGAGWDEVDVNVMTRLSGVVYFEFNAIRTSELAPEGVLVDVPAGFRQTTWHAWTQAWGLNGAWSNNQIYYDIATHKIRSKNGAHVDDSIAASMSWPLI